MGERDKSGLNGFKANRNTNLSNLAGKLRKVQHRRACRSVQAIACSTVLPLRWFAAHVIEPSTLSCVCERAVWRSHTALGSEAV